MNFEQKYGGLHSNQKLLIQELINRNIDVEVINTELELIKARFGEHEELILDRDSSIMPYATSVLVGDKGLTKKFLKSAGISVPIGTAFNLKDDSYILEAFKMYENPVVIKPVFGSHGYDVYINLDTEEKVKASLEKIKINRGSNTNILIEEYFEGNEYRVFITKHGDYAVLFREPAHVIGDGIHTIKELADIETNKRMNPRTNALCPILIDNEVNKFLKHKKMTLNDIPKPNEKIYLRANSNVAMGGLCIDYTDKVHPSVIENCKQVLKAIPGLPYAGIDYMSKDITKEQTNDMYSIIEVNTVPGIHMHMRPALGTPRNVAKYIVDMMYPETVVHENEKRLIRKF
ncbi:MAG: ATP-grasp domain-containing protein [Bacilli bacterium]|nr:ATP-grasp domain-containing protein [Bacilli bacterium]